MRVLVSSICRASTDLDNFERTKLAKPDDNAELRPEVSFVGNRLAQTCVGYSNTSRLCVRLRTQKKDFMSLERTGVWCSCSPFNSLEVSPLKIVEGFSLGKDSRVAMMVGSLLLRASPTSGLGPNRSMHY